MLLLVPSAMELRVLVERVFLEGFGTALGRSVGGAMVCDKGAWVFSPGRLFHQRMNGSLG